MQTQQIPLTQEEREARDTRRNFYLDIAERAAKLKLEKNPLTQTCPLVNAPPIAPVVYMPPRQPDPEPMQHVLDYRFCVAMRKQKAAKKSLNVGVIRQVVADAYGIIPSAICSSSRKRDKSRPRQVAMYVAKTHSGRSLLDIGRRFGDRDHTTVLHAVRKIAALVGDTSVSQAPNFVAPVIDQALRDKIEIIKSQLLLLVSL